MRPYEIPAWQALAILAYLFSPLFLIGGLYLYEMIIDKWEDR